MPATRRRAGRSRQTGTGDTAVLGRQFVHGLPKGLCVRPKVTAAKTVDRSSPLLQYTPLYYMSIILNTVDGHVPTTGRLLCSSYDAPSKANEVNKSRPRLFATGVSRPLHWARSRLSGNPSFFYYLIRLKRLRELTEVGTWLIQILFWLPLLGGKLTTRLARA